jgi:hypothetical protein
VARAGDRSERGVLPSWRSEDQRGGRAGGRADLSGYTRRAACVRAQGMQQGMQQSQQSSFAPKLPLRTVAALWLRGWWRQKRAAVRAVGGSPRMPVSLSATAVLSRTGPRRREKKGAGKHGTHAHPFRGVRVQPILPCPRSALLHRGQGGRVGGPVGWHRISHEPLVQSAPTLFSHEPLVQRAPTLQATSLRGLLACRSSQGRATRG